MATVALVIMLLLEPQLAEGHDDTGKVHEPGLKGPAIPKQDLVKDELQEKERSVKEETPKKGASEQEEVGEASSGEAKKKASSFGATGSSTSSSSSVSPPMNSQEIQPPAKQKPTKANKNNQKQDSAPEKVAADDQQETVKLEESGNGDGEGKEAVLQEDAAKGPNPGHIQGESEVVGSDSAKKEVAVDENEKAAPEVDKDAKDSQTMETSFEKHMGSGASDPPQTNFFSYFIVLAIISIIAYLVFHNKKKILGLIVEGRSGRQAGRRRSGGREYRKLDSNVEDMMENGRDTSMRQVIY